MRIFAGNSLADKLKWMALITTAVALGTLVFTLLIFDRVRSQAMLQERLATLADVIGQNSTAALNFNDRPAATEVLEALRAEPQVVSACLYDLSGNLFAQYQRDREAVSCPEGAYFSQVQWQNPSILRPALRHKEVVGTLLLSADLQDLQRRQIRLLLVAGCLVVLALTVGGVTGSILQRRISKPIFDLAAAMHNVTAEQDFTTRVPVSGSDEIADLANGFNTMLSELERRDTAKRAIEAKLEFQALNDALTGLPNRRLLSDRLTQVLAAARRESRIVALLYIDLDGFKLVNDSLGHCVGDTLLVQVASRLQSRVRQSDTLARLGGDEFTVVLAGIHAKQDAELVAKNLLDVLSAPFNINDHQLTIGASIGISLFPENAAEAADLMQQADSAMYAAKRDGKKRAAYFTPELGVLVRERLNLENQLRGAIARGEIKVHYQPEFEAVSKRLIRFEALARWIHPTLGNIPPNKFIPVAEESGFIVSLGAYVLETACSEAVRWQTIAARPIQVAVNVSSIQFKRAHFVDDVIGVLKRTGLRPELLQLELTESIMLSGVHQASETMRRLRALGISMAIDDFGTGYSCLSYLPSLPFDALKIDRAFVKELEKNPESQVMVRSLIALAHNVGMRVIVEGVEKLEQLELVTQAGGNEIQGFLLGRPTQDPASQLLALQKQLPPARSKAPGGEPEIIKSP